MKALAIGLLGSGYAAFASGICWAAVKMEGGDPAAGLCLGGLFIIGAGVAVWEAKR